MTPQSNTKNTWEGLIAPPARQLPQVTAKTRPSRRPARSAGPDASRSEPIAGAPAVRQKELRILLVSAPGLFSDMLGQALQGLASEVRVVQSGPSTAVSQAGDADLILVDIESTGNEAERLLAALRRQLSAPLVALGEKEDAAVMGRTLAAGAAAFLAKTEPASHALQLLRAVLARSGAEGGVTDLPEAGADNPGLPSRKPPREDRPYGLTAAQLRVLALLAEGMSNQAIAKRRGICEGTVKIHLNAIYQKLGVQSRTQAARIAQRLDAVRDVQIERAADGRALLDWLLPYMTSEARAAGDLLFKRGDPSDSLYFVQQGCVRLSEIERDVGDGQLLGEVGVFAPEHRRTCTARCAADTRLFRLSAEQAKRLYFENPEFAFHLMQLVAQRLAADRERLGVG
jgi:two-component system, NarL family, nitrate/nitrite response regulator NarL